MTRVVMGRPAVFHKDPERDRLAERRLEQAAYLAGFEEVRFQLEPIAAARAFEQRLESDVNCLVGDLGGGTSDFTVMRLGPKRGGDRRGDVLGSDGVSVAGNDLDAALVRLRVLPRLGYGSSYSPLGRPIPLPTKLHVAMTSWHALSFVNTSQNLEELAGWIRTADDPEGLSRLYELLDWNLGFELFRSVERCKLELSLGSEGVLSFRARNLALDEPVSRRVGGRHPPPGAEARGLRGRADGAAGTPSDRRGLPDRRDQPGAGGPGPVRATLPRSAAGRAGVHERGRRSGGRGEGDLGLRNPG